MKLNTNGYGEKTGFDPLKKYISVAYLYSTEN